MEKPKHNDESKSNSKQTYINLDFGNLCVDPCLKRKFSNYQRNDTDQLQRAYLQIRRDHVKQLTIIFHKTIWQNIASV